MRRITIAITTIALLAAYCHSTSQGLNVVADRRLADAMIVHMDPPLKRTLTAIPVFDAKDLADLAKFFPNFEQRPKSDTAGGWIAGYRVYFRFSDGEILCVTVSENENGAYWTTGHGDFRTNGNFVSFAERLKR